MSTWIIGAISLLAGFALGVISGIFYQARSWLPRVERLSSEKDRALERLEDSQLRYVDLLRRELANHLISGGVEDFKAVFYELWDWEREMHKASKEVWQRELNMITVTYPVFEDFDIFNTRHTISYEQTDLNREDLLSHYKAMTKFLILRNSKVGEKEDPSTVRYLMDAKEVKAFESDISWRADRGLRQHLDRAICRMAISQYASQREDYLILYEDPDYIIRRVPELERYTPEIKKGVILKETGECGVISTFNTDDNKRITSYYRSNAAFTEEIPLNA